MASLRLELAASGTAVLLRSAEEHLTNLRQLAPRFRTAIHKGPNVIEIKLDDLLVNLRELSRWPSPHDVDWQSELRTIVEDVHLDASAATAYLQGTAPATAPLSKDEIFELLGPEWIAPLTEFQLRDISKLLSLRHGANFSVPGAGKTRVALAIFQALRTKGLVQRLLVVGPKAAYESWQYENKICLSQPLNVQVIDGKVDAGARLLLVNYERLAINETALAKWLTTKPSMLILDEAHRMKLGATGVYGAVCLALGPRARRRLILTGTPAPNGVQDLENIFGFVWPGHGRQSVTRAVSGGNLKHASKVLRPFFTRTTKKELNLPPVTTRIQRVAFKPGSLHGEIYSALVGEMSARAARSRDDFEALGRILMYLLMAATSPALIALGTTKHEPLLYQAPPIEIPENRTLTELLKDLPNHEMSPKYEATHDIVLANSSTKRKTLVWSTFVRSLTTLESILKEHQPAMVHGGTPDRENQIKRFREDPDCMVLLSNPATLGEGISLHQVCHDAVYVDRDFAAGRYLQSLDRIHRLGLSSNIETNVTVLATAETIDEMVEQRLSTKLRFMGAILDDPEVEQLADLQEEPVAGRTMDSADVKAMLRHLHVGPTS